MGFLWSRPSCAADTFASVDLKDLKTYQQLFVYFVPLVTNVGFINAFVVGVRLYWFERHINKSGRSAELDHGSRTDVSQHP